MALVLVLAYAAADPEKANELTEVLSNTTRETNVSPVLRVHRRRNRHRLRRRFPRTRCTPAGPPSSENVSGNASGWDTMQVGSGTKPFTAAAVLQLVGRGKLRLADFVHEHIDAPLHSMWYGAGWLLWPAWRPRWGP